MQRKSSRSLQRITLKASLYSDRYELKSYCHFALYFSASLMVQRVKNLPAMQEIQETGV